MLEQLRKHFQNLEKGSYVEDDNTGKGLVVLYEKDERLLSQSMGQRLGCITIWKKLLSGY